MKIEELTINLKQYPNKLKQIYDPPAKIYILGNKELLYKKSVAIVGARKSTIYGRKIAYNISKELNKKGVVIISGLALGIDTYAHLGALEGGTIAVLGSGIDKIYPKENIELARKIVKNGGCIISEYPIGTMPQKQYFPQRNRIISGLSNGVLVVEATKKSGALITADFALEQGKEVFAVPGDITRTESEGCNELIKDGAILVASEKEILENILYLS